MKFIFVLLCAAAIFVNCDDSIDFSVEIIKKPCNDGHGVCVPILLCKNHQKTESSDDSGFTVIGYSTADDDVGGCHYMEKCCEPENVISENQGHSSVMKRRNKVAEDSCIQQCKSALPGPIRKPPIIDEGTQVAVNKICGFRNDQGVGIKLSNSSDIAEFAEFPWMMALSENDKYICGGSLIHPNVVLTAAHCVHEKNALDLKARAGEWDTQTTNEPFGHVDHVVKKIVSNSDFGPKNLFNDIALLVLEHPVKLTAHINTICLPPLKANFDSSNCIASGWGADKFEQEGAYRANLKKVDLPVVTLKYCQDRLRTTPLGPLFKLHPSFMCAGGEKGVDMCTGDGGSPLVCPIPNNGAYYYQAGIVSYGMKCGMAGIPAVYTNVAKFRGWIDNEMEALGFETDYYTF